MSGIFVPLILIAAGLIIAITPAEKLVKWDRRTGYWLYKNAPDHTTGLRRANIFYKIFGSLFIVVGFIIVISGVYRLFEF